MDLLIKKTLEDNTKRTLSHNRNHPNRKEKSKLKGLGCSSGGRSGQWEYTT